MSKPIVWSRVRLPSLALHRGTLVLALVALLLSWANRIWGLLPELHLIVLTPFLLAMFVAIRVTKRRGVLRDGEAIVVVDERGREKGRFALATVATLEASLETKRNEPTVVQEANLAFVREDGALIADMTFGTVEERRTALAELGLVAGELRTTYRAGKRALVLPWREQLAFVGVLAVPFVTGLALHGWAILMYNAPLSVLPMVVNMLASLSGVTVGADGLRVAKPLHRRFYPYERIRRIDAIPGTDRLVLALDDGPLDLPTRGGRAFDAERSEVASALEVALERYRDLARQAPVVPFADSPDPFRRADPTVDVLLRIVENPSIRLSSRVEAARRAIALDASARLRVRVAAASSADDDSRDALEHCDDPPLRRSG
ncbi:MAG: hypothetical protein U0183_14270 [Polyangiaceae bacterium]